MHFGMQPDANCTLHTLVTKCDALSACSALKCIVSTSITRRSVTDL